MKECEKFENKSVFYSVKDKKIFDAEEVKYLPTVIVFSNGKEILRLESGISMKLPEDSEKQIKEKVNSLIESKF